MTDKIKIIEALTYGATIVPDGDGYLVTFKDVDNAYSWAESYAQAVLNAREVLDLMLLDRIEKGDEIPIPSCISKKNVPISVRPDVGAHAN